MRRRTIAGFLLVAALTMYTNALVDAEESTEILSMEEIITEETAEIQADEIAVEETEDTVQENSENTESIESIEIPDDTEEETERETEEETEVEDLQQQIDGLPDLDTYDYLSLDEKNETRQQIGELKETYFEEFTDEQRSETNAEALLSLDLYTESYAYYQTEEEYDGQLTLEDRSTGAVSEAGLQNLQQQIDALPELEEITGEQGEVSYTENGSCLSPEDTDDLYQDVYDAASVYYKLPEEQVEEVDGEKVTALTAYFSVGVSTVASAPAIGSITYYENPVYNGTMTTHHPHYGYYEVSTQNSEGEKVAFCMDSNASTPGAAGTSLHAERAITDMKIRTILYYGYGGPGELVEHTRNGYCETHMAICYAMDYNSSNNDFAKAAFDLLYTNAPDQNAGQNVEAWAASTGVSGTQDLVYARFIRTHTNTLTIRKLGAGKVVLQGAVFELSDADTGEVIGTGTTDANGQIIWTDLADGNYAITETTAAGGYELLNNPVTIALPFRITKEEAEEKAVDTSEAYYDEDTGQWCFPFRTCEITDASRMTIPYTGGQTGRIRVFSSATGYLLVFFCMFLLKKEKC